MGASLIPSSVVFKVVFLALNSLWCFPELANGAGITRHYKFNIKLQNVTRLCHTKSIVSVNGQFPGPPIVAREGDRVVVKVTNHVQNNITIHWHGVRQLEDGLDCNRREASKPEAASSTLRSSQVLTPLLPKRFPHHLGLK